MQLQVILISSKAETFHQLTICMIAPEQRYVYKATVMSDR